MNHRIISVVIGVVIIAVIIGGAVYWEPPRDNGGIAPPTIGPAPAAGAPTITWTPRALSEEIARGHSKTVRISFASSAAVTNVAVRVVPELQPFVQVSPTTFASIGTHQTVNVDVTFGASTTAPFGAFNGTIQLRIGNTLAKPLPVTLLVTVVALPPDPGEAGKQTLEGIDSDGDGVRDDVQRYIGLTYPSSARARATLTQYGKALQEIVVAGGHGASVSGIVSHWTRAIDCAAALYGEVETKRLLDGVRAKLLNTRDRSTGYIRSSQELSGQSFPVDLAVDARSLCDFDLGAVPN